jgi:ribulose-5-phosphate 4-epimerase/fuculose-1-phosphate aldolase
LNKTAHASAHVISVNSAKNSTTQAYELRGAGAVIHSHSMNALLATLLEPDSDEFSVTHIEMIKVWLS